MGTIKRIGMDRVSGTSLVGYFPASYAELRSVLGEPDASDEYKVSSEWVVEHAGRVWTIYDYNETSLYDPSCPSVEQFRAKPEYVWHIGGFDSEGLDEFLGDLRAWLDVDGVKGVPEAVVDAERAELEALASGEGLEMLPRAALIASIRYLAGKLLKVSA